VKELEVGGFRQERDEVRRERGIGVYIIYGLGQGGGQWRATTGYPQTDRGRG